MTDGRVRQAHVIRFLVDVARFGLVPARLLDDRLDSPAIAINSDLAALCFIYLEGEEVLQADLRGVTGLGLDGVSRVVSRLVAARHVSQREPPADVADRRYKLVRLTARGRTYLAGCADIVWEHYVANPGDIRMLAAAASRFEAALRAG